MLDYIADRFWTYLAAICVCIFVFGMCVAPVFAYQKPLTIPTFNVPNYNVTIAVFGVQTAIGHSIGVLELQNGDWKLCGTCSAALEYPTFDSVVNAAGGTGPFVLSTIPAVNTILANRYPPIGTPEPVNTLNSINTKLSTCIISMVNGVPQFGCP
jgi:hypothetical protein